MPDDLTMYKIFIASPSDLQDVRAAFCEVIEEHNQVDANARGVEFKAVRWEDMPPSVGRPQDIINQALRASDYFVMVLYTHWGSPPDREGNYTSGTEEEFATARECLAGNAPMRGIAALFRGVSPERLEKPDPDLQKVQEFRQRLEDENELFYGTFGLVEEFKIILRKLLAQWVRDYEAETPPAAATGGPILATSDAQPTVPNPAGSSSPETLRALEQAEHLGEAGKPVAAETAYAKEVVKNDPTAIDAFGHFLFRTGRYSQAQEMYERVAEMGEQSQPPRWQAVARGNLGIIYCDRGNMDMAEAAFKKSLKIFEDLNDWKGIASNKSNLGNVYRIRGNLPKAEDTLKEALRINESHGCHEGMAIQCINLGRIYKDRGDLGEAKRFWTKAVAFFNQAGNLTEAALAQRLLDGLADD